MAGPRPAADPIEAGSPPAKAPCPEEKAVLTEPHAATYAALGEKAKSKMDLYWPTPTHDTYFAHVYDVPGVKGAVVGVIDGDYVRAGDRCMWNALKLPCLLKSMRPWGQNTAPDGETQPEQRDECAPDRETLVKSYNTTIESIAGAFNITVHRTADEDAIVKAGFRAWDAYKDGRNMTYTRRDMLVTVALFDGQPIGFLYCKAPPHLECVCFSLTAAALVAENASEPAGDARKYPLHQDIFRWCFAAITEAAGEGIQRMTMVAPYSCEEGVVAAMRAAGFPDPHGEGWRGDFSTHLVEFPTTAAAGLVGVLAKRPAGAWMESLQPRA
jgi:hypothetical protein